MKRALLLLATALCIGAYMGHGAIETLQRAIVTHAQHIA